MKKVFKNSWVQIISLGLVIGFVFIILESMDSTWITTKFCKGVVTLFEATSLPYFNEFIRGSSSEKRKTSDKLLAKVPYLSTIRDSFMLTGFKNCYRIRLGNYRIGLLVEDKTVIFAAFDHRSGIYKYFP